MVIIKITYRANEKNKCKDNKKEKTSTKQKLRAKKFLRAYIKTIPFKFSPKTN